LAANSKYGLILANPKEFYNEIHRTSHFLKFNESKDDKINDNADLEDFFE
jgi:pre-mRNA-processing factor 8